MALSTDIHELVQEFNLNWTTWNEDYRWDFEQDLSEQKTRHCWGNQIAELNSNRGGSLPLVHLDADHNPKDIYWYTMAPNPLLLQTRVRELESWILPSYGWLDKEDGDGYRELSQGGTGIQAATAKVSPQFYRWRCKKEDFKTVCARLRWKTELEKSRPDRKKRMPSLFELRHRFENALLIGDADLAEESIKDIDHRELDRAFNTEVMKIRMWHTFREFAKIEEVRERLPQRNLPRSVSEILADVCGDKQEIPPETASPSNAEDRSPSTDKKNHASESETAVDYEDWETWFRLLIDDRDKTGVREWLDEKPAAMAIEVSEQRIQFYTEKWEHVFCDAELLQEFEHLINLGLIRFLDDYVRESHFPRTEFAQLYLALLLIWGEQKGGTAIGKEEGHVFLELAGALLRLNHEVDEVKGAIERWWSSRPSPALLPYALDAVELLSVEHPDPSSYENLWLEAADFAKRSHESLLQSEKELWRITGLNIGIPEETLTEYFPIEHSETADPLLCLRAKKVAIVCMRPRQGAAAAKIIEERSGAKTVIVSTKKPAKESEQALTCEVVLFVWMATTHAVFRAFDNFDRNRLCYVQGTGSSSIVRSLERWTKLHSAKMKT